jgi:hypothetical protein
MGVRRFKISIICIPEPNRIGGPLSTSLSRSTVRLDANYTTSRSTTDKWKRQKRYVNSIGVFLIRLPCNYYTVLHSLAHRGRPFSNTSLASLKLMTICPDMKCSRVYRVDIHRKLILHQDSIKSAHQRSGIDHPSRTNNHKMQAFLNMQFNDSHWTTPNFVALDFFYKVSYKVPTIVLKKETS